MKYSYIALLPFQYRLGQPDNCLDFFNVTVCLLEYMPQYVPSWVDIESNQQVYTTAPLYNDDYAPETVMIEDQWLFAPGKNCQQNAQWHLLRASTHEPQLSTTTYAYGAADGSSSNVFVFDTWVDVEHGGFNADRRPERLKAFAPHNETGYPPAHGTHVTGLICSEVYGTARSAHVHTIQVLDDGGYGDYAASIQALHYAHDYISRYRLQKVIFNLSFGGGQSPIFDRVINDLSDLYFIVVAAGNSNQDTGLSSPGSAIKAYTVAAMNVDNEMASFSNYGKNVKIQAPGESMLSLCPRNYLCWMSGTSMASPFVAGIVAVEWSKVGMSREQIETYITAHATKGILKTVKRDTVNSVIYLQPNHKC